MGKIKDLTGKQFDRLTAIRQCGRDKNGRVLWECKCNCGNPNLIKVSSNCLTQGTVRSCGCLKSDCQRIYNEYDLSGEYGVGYCKQPNKYGEYKFYFDLEDYDKIKNYTWSFDKKYGYVRAWNSKGNPCYIKMHRLVMGVVDPKINVDHKHGNETINDNRKSNLRIATKTENARNHKLHNDNTSGCSGVQWKPKCQAWEAWITVNYKKIYLGTFVNKEDAIKARKDAENKYFGEWSYDNSQSS